jgi:hypothetical protein
MYESSRTQAYRHRREEAEAAHLRSTLLYHVLTAVFVAVTLAVFVVAVRLGAQAVSAAFSVETVSTIPGY